MSKSNLLFQITNGAWLIEPSAIYQFAPLVQTLFERNAAFLDADIKEPAIQAISADGSVTFGNRWDGFSKAAPNSTAVISISGAIMKNDNCGDAGTKTLGSLLKQAIGSPNINSIVLVIDSPGGTVAGTEDFATIVKNSSKPIVTYVEGMMASAAYWIGSQAKEVYAGSKTDMIGSIGTMMSFADAQPMWEKEGVKFHEVYATKSTDKNKDFAEARKGNYTKVIERLDAINAVFLQNVKDARGSKLNEKDTLSGKVFMADDAIANGLIDGFMSFEEVIARAQELAQEQSALVQSNNNQNPKKQMKIKATLAALTGLLASSFSGWKAEETILTEEHLEKIDSELQAAEKLKADLKIAQDSASKFEADLKAANSTIEALTQEKANVTAEFEKFKTSSAGATETEKKGSDKVEVEKEDEFLTSFDKEKAEMKRRFE